MNAIEIPEQPFPAHLAQACEWLAAVERRDCDPTDEHGIRAGLVVGEALGVLTDVDPPYPPLTDAYAPVTLAEARPVVLAELEQAAAVSAVNVEQRLRIARAVRILTEPTPPLMRGAT